MRKGSNEDWKLRIEFHNSYVVMALGFVLTGYYWNLLVFTSLILVHELGHYMIAKGLGFKVDKIVVYPYGGMTKLDGLVNVWIGEELLVASMGVIVQFLFYLFMCYINKLGVIRDYIINLYTLYSNQMIFFNLLPIYPLDGGKIVNLLFSKYFSYRLANGLSIFISGVMLFLLVGLNVYVCNYSNVMVFLLLFTYLWKFYQRRDYLYQKLLLERYLYQIGYPKVKVINNYRGMYKNCSHVIFNGQEYVLEREWLKRRFS